MTQVLPAQHVVVPVKPLPPHWDLCAVRDGDASSSGRNLPNGTAGLALLEEGSSEGGGCQSSGEKDFAGHCGRTIDWGENGLVSTETNLETRRGNEPYIVHLTTSPASCGCEPVLSCSPSGSTGKLPSVPMGTSFRGAMALRRGVEESGRVDGNFRGRASGAGPCQASFGVRARRRYTEWRDATSQAQLRRQPKIGSRCLRVWAGDGETSRIRQPGIA